MSQFTISMIMGYAAFFFIGGMNVLHILTFQSMVNVNLPANVMLFQNTVTSFLTMDLIPPEMTTELIFDCKPDKAYVEYLNMNKIDTMLSNQI